MTTCLSYPDAQDVDHDYETVAVNLTAAYEPKNVNCDRISTGETNSY